MENFDFFNPTKIVFGKGKENKIGGIIKNILTEMLKNAND